MASTYIIHTSDQHAMAVRSEGMQPIKRALESLSATEWKSESLLPEPPCVYENLVELGFAERHTDYVGGLPAVKQYRLRPKANRK